jgi:hypothetical protein
MNRIFLVNEIGICPVARSEPKESRQSHRKAFLFDNENRQSLLVRLIGGESQLL